MTESMYRLKIPIPLHYYEDAIKKLDSYDGLAIRIDGNLIAIDVGPLCF